MFPIKQRNPLKIFRSGDYRTVRKSGQRSGEVTIDGRWVVVKRSPRNSQCIAEHSSSICWGSLIQEV
jgi:hypothetical protein